MSAGGYYQFVPEELADRYRSVLESLEGSGLNLKRGRTGNQSLPGVVFFENETLDLYAALDAARDSRAPALAACLCPASLTPAASWRILLAGAADVLVWRQDKAASADIASRLLRWLKIDELLSSPAVRANLVGHSSAWMAVLRQLVDAAHFSASPCLLLGESGTGKELAARLIHTLDPRPAKRDMIVVDCSTIVPDLSGSEFFGHERGAYTGAVHAREGAFALADGGTLFLDEVGELSLPLQAQLLRVIQEGQFKRVGGNEWQRTEFRLVCATNRNLEQDVLDGRFRRDLYYRVAGAVIRLPPLRDRTDDILPLAEHFGAGLGLDPAVRAFLVSRDYPGNIRDLRQVVLRMCQRHAGAGPLTLGDIAEEDRPRLDSPLGEWSGPEFRSAIRRALAHGIPLKEVSRVAAECAIGLALEETGGNVSKAARLLGVTDRALQLRRAARREDSTARMKAKGA